MFPQDVLRSRPVEEAVVAKEDVNELVEPDLQSTFALALRDDSQFARIAAELLVNLGPVVLIDNTTPDQSYGTR